MSKLLTLINRLKAQTSWTMLTPGQRLAFAELEKRWQFPDRLNLYGPQGSGKTFLGWVLARHLPQVNFYASPRLFEQDQAPYPTDIIIDNAPSEEKKLRRLLSELQLRQVRRVLFVTQSPIRLGWSTIELASPTAADIATIYENCSKLQFYPSPSSSNESPRIIFRNTGESNEEIANYWQVIFSVL